MRWMMLGLWVLAAPAASGESSNPYARTDVLVKVGLGLAAPHMVDNFLVRRTFAPPTVAPTLVQGLYVGGALAHALDAGPLFWILFSTSMLTAHSLGHLFIPSATNHLSTFHRNWATGDNRLGVHSGAVGRVSQGVLLDLTFLAILVSSIDDGIRHGFTLRQVRPGPPER
jgi:hypothetical protein